MEERDGVGLARAIEALRKELLQAAVVGENEQMRFAIEPIELTLQVAVTLDASGKAGWRILEVGGKVDRAVTQTLTVRLIPLWKTEDGKITQDFSVAADAVARAKFE